MEGLEDEVAGVLAHVAVAREPAHLVDVGALRVRAQEHDGQVAAGEDAAGRLGSVYAPAEVDVHEDEVDLLSGAGGLDRLLARGGEQDAVAETFDGELLGEGGDRLVFHEQDRAFFWHGTSIVETGAAVRASSGAAGRGILWNPARGGAS